MSSERSRKVRFAVAASLLAAAAVPTFLGARKILSRDEEPFAADDARLRAQLATRKLTVNFNETPATEIANFMGDILRLPCSATRTLDDLKLTIQLKDLPATECLARFSAAQPELRTTVTHGLLVFHRRADPRATFPTKIPTAETVLEGMDCAAPITLDFVRAPLDDVAAELSEMTRLPFVAKDSLVDGVTLHLQDARFDDALQVLCETHKLGVTVAAGRLVLVSRP